MKKTVAIVTGMALAASMAIAAQAQETEDYDPNRDIVTESESDRDMSMDAPRQDTPVQSEYGTEPETQTESDMSTDPYGTDPTQSQTDTSTDTYGEHPATTESSAEQSASTWEDEAGKDVSDMTADKLSGKTVVTSAGEEIGDIDEVGYSSTHQERVAVIEAGGFLGVGEKRIAVPLSELQMGTEDNITTSLTRESIEAQEEFDEAGFTADQPDTSGEIEQ